MSIQRRDFIRHALLGSGALASGLLTSCNDYENTPLYTFTHGVASGDPWADRVILWTRVVPLEKNTVTVVWQIASDNTFNQLISQGKAETDISRDYTVKVDATGLSAHQTYYYRFKAGSVTSPIGQTRTLPDSSIAQVKLAVFSCSNYPAGYFHVYAEAAKRTDLQAAIHLGDYIYEYGAGADQYASADAQALGRVSLPNHELLSLSDYRARYAQYRSDPDLQTLHARLPFICIWDDHEIANDTYKAGAENHAANEGDFLQRRAVALKAWLEWLPVRESNPSQPLRIYRSFQFGSLLSLHMLDTRVIARDRQLDYADYIDASTGNFDAQGFSQAMADPSRQLLGSEQVAWLQQQLASSTARWQVLGQQVLMGKMYLPAPLLTPTPQNPSISFADYGVIATAFTTYQAVSQQLQTQQIALTPANLLAAGMTNEQLAIINDPAKQAIIKAPSIPYNLDAWDGYAVARETLFAISKTLNKNLVVLSGDTHNAWANDLKTLAGEAVGVEFATSSVSSPGLEEYLPTTEPKSFTAGLLQLIPTLAYANTYQRGYMVLSVTEQAAQADWYFVSTIKAKTYTLSHEKSLKTLAGSAKITRT